MGQRLTIGSVTLGDDCASFTIQRNGIVGRTGRLNKVRHAWIINGYVKAPAGLTNAASRASVDAQVVQVENAVRDGIDLTFSLGSTARLMSNLCAEGTHIREFSWLRGFDGVRGSGAEALLRRTFKLVVYGDIIQASDTDLIFYKDTLRFIGNGSSNNVPVGSLTGPVQSQQTQKFTPVWVIQSGSAVGLTTQPAPPTPQFLSTGNFEQPGGFMISNSTADSPGINVSTGFGCSWAYKCWISTYIAPQVPTGLF